MFRQLVVAERKERKKRKRKKEDLDLGSYLAIHLFRSTTTTTKKIGGEKVSLDSISRALFSPHWQQKYVMRGQTVADRKREGLARYREEPGVCIGGRRKKNGRL